MIALLALLFLVSLGSISTASGVAFVPGHNRGECRFFLDTANEREWDDLLPTGMFHGITTNPPVLLQEEVPQPCTVDNLHRLGSIALQSVSEFMCQTWGSTATEMYETGMALTAPARDKIVVKVPVTVAGVQAATKLIRAGCRVCLTAACHHKQALIAASIGAEYIAPCLGLMSDAGRDGPQECKDMLEIVRGVKAPTRILVACIRDVSTLSQLACAGMSSFSFTPAIARELFVDPLTEQTAAILEQAAQHNRPPAETMEECDCQGEECDCEVEAPEFREGQRMVIKKEMYNGENHPEEESHEEEELCDFQKD